MARELAQVDALLYNLLSGSDEIKTRMGITSGPARVTGYRVPRDPAYLSEEQPFYIFFYSIPGVGTRVNGNRIVQYNPDYDIEVRSLGAPTDEAEYVVGIIQDTIGSMKAVLTPNHLWVVSSVFVKDISIIEPGESPEIYYTRRGGTFKFAVVAA